MQADTAHDDASPPDGERDFYIKVRKSDIIGQLRRHEALGDDGEKFSRFCRLLAAVYHFQFFAKLERLREDYYYFNPENAATAHVDALALGRAHDELVATFVAVLKEANFSEIPRAEIARAHAEHHTLRVSVETPLDDYRDVLFFRRGQHCKTVEIREWFGLRRRSVDVLVYDHVVLMVMIKREAELRARRKRRVRRPVRTRLRPGSILIKYFRDIPRPDLDMLFPEVRVVMSLFDKLVLGVPAIAGILPLMFNLLPTLTVLVVVAGFYLGFAGSIHDDDEKKALAALSGLAALGAFAVRQWTKYQRRALSYHKAIADNVYFRNINNNAGIFDYLVGAAEEQESKEAFLAYFFLLAARGAVGKQQVEDSVKAWLRSTFGVDAEFEIDDALRKLDSLGLLKRHNETFSVVSLDAAIARLEHIWGGLLAADTAAAAAAT
ncbi:MAG: DUF3754 domain-containing protein [Proteobacteria bacterium]|nr:DUF3754 domain-containing protein [Pseudomonadota bacterium]